MMLITYRELYPGAIGHIEDLDREVAIQRIRTFEVVGSSTVSFPSNKLASKDGGTVDLLTGGYAALNNSRASILYQI